MAAPQGTIDIVATRILVESQEALQALKNFDAGVNQTTNNLDKIAIKMAFVRRNTGRSIKELVDEFKKINDPKKGGQFGTLGVNNAQIENAGKLVALYEKMLGVQAKNTAEANKIAAAEKKSTDAAAKRAAQQALPQNAIPAFVNKQFGDINSYIAQSSDKVAAWKTVVQQSAKAAGVSFEQAGTQLKKMVSGTTVAPLNTALKQLGDDGRSSFQKLIDGAHFARIALGALVSMVLFNVLQAFTSTFTEASKQARELEENIWRLTNAERALSEAGTDISLKSMEDSITKIQKKFKVFSREDITQLYSSIAVATKQLNLSGKELSDLTESVVFLNIQSVKQESLLETNASLLSSLLGKSSTGVSQLGVSFKNTFIEQEALRLGMIKTGQALSDLTDEEIAHVKVSLLVQAGYVDSAEGLAIVNEFLETNSAKLQTNTATWKDFLAVVGQGINNLLPNFAPAIEELQKSFEVAGIQKLFEKAIEDDGFRKFALQNQIIFSKLSLGIKLTQKEYDKLKQSLSELSDRQILDIFPDPSAIKDRFSRELIQSLVEIKDTATEAKPAIDDLLNADDEELLETLEDIEEKIQDIILDAQQAQEDLDLKLEQKTQDLDTEYIRKGEDAAIDHADKLEDINQDALDKIEDAKRKSREDEEKAERDLLQKLKELRQRFLMDLEDALHERDARQVLRLIREYKFDKQNILDKKKLEDQERKESLQADLEAIEIERRRRIESENIEYQRKLADLAQAKQREQEELALWYAREQEDIARNVQQKLEKLLAGYIAEGRIHEDQQAAIYATLVKYFGKDMALVDSLAQFMAQRFGQINSMAQQAVAGSLNAMLGLQNMTNPFATPATAGSLNALINKPQNYNPFSGGFAEGGSVIATKPTRAIFGERGAEMATFTPLGRTGKDVNKLFGDVSGGGGANGMAKVLLSLSPDLEARILDDAMSGVALTIERVRREKR